MGERESIVVVDLGYGDQGKGSVTDFLVRDRGAHTVVRYNGGAQAGHNVVTTDGRHHTFAQFGAGMFVPGVETFLSKFMAIQPWAMAVEADYLSRAGVADAFARTQIADGAPVITPFHRAANRLRELARGGGRHGSCGVGVGETVSDARTLGEDLVVRAADLRNRKTLNAKMRRVQEHKRSELAEIVTALRDDPAARDDIESLENARTVGVCVPQLARFITYARVVDERAWDRVLQRSGAMVFEGAQGVLLDEWRGFHPYTTWSTCTPDNARAMLARYDGDVTVLGVVRAYATRHGAGPFVTEDAELASRIPDAHNVAHPWQGDFRVGWFDAVATRYAIGACGGVDALAVTCVDRLRDETEFKIATGYVIDGEVVHDLQPGPPQDIPYQSALTERVMRAAPAYEVTARSGDVDAHLAAIAERCGRVSLISEGPTASDKRCCPPGRLAR